MSKFARWSQIAHTILAKSHPEIKPGTVREILAAYLGHRTYASFRRHDCDALDEQAKYVLADPESARFRARNLDAPLTTDEWNEVEAALKPSGATGRAWLIQEGGMYRAAASTIASADDTRLHAIARNIGMVDGYRSSNTRCHSPSGAFPLDLRFTVVGEIRARSDAGRFAIPVVCEVGFRRVGIRLYGAGQVKAVAQRGEPRACEHEEPDVDFASLGNLDD